MNVDLSLCFQILFHSAAAINAYRIYADAKELARCLTSVDEVKETSEENEHYKTCYTGAIAFLKPGQLLQLRTSHNYTISRQNNSNFFGLFRISVWISRLQKADGSICRQAVCLVVYKRASNFGKLLSCCLDNINNTWQRSHCTSPVFIHLGQ